MNLSSKEIENLVKQDLLEYYDQYYHLAYRYMGNDSDALDVVQESAYKAMKAAHKLKNEENIHGWVYRIVANTSLSLLRKNKRTVTLDQEVSVVDNIITNENEALEFVLNHLNDEQRLLIHLRFEEDYKIEEIASIMNLNINTVKSKLYRTLEFMENMLRQRGYQYEQ